MESLALIGYLLIAALLAATVAVTVRRSRLSRFELTRRISEKNTTAQDELKREVAVDDIVALKKTFEAALAVVMAVCSIGAFGVWLGGLAALVAVIPVGYVSRIEFVRTWAQKVYEQYEPKLLHFIEEHPMFSKLTYQVIEEYEDPLPSSREEIEHRVMTSKGLLSESEKKVIVSSMHFNSKTVEEIMTPRGMMTTLRKDEVLGPLMLNDLHQTGHSRFPVIDGDIDHVVGVLHIQELLTLTDKTSETAGEAMERKVYYIEQTQTLDEALAAFISSHHHLFIVINEYRETAGIITLEDVIEALIGQRIVDEYDAHDDLRTVAKRSAKSKNNPPDAVDV